VVGKRSPSILKERDVPAPLAEAWAGATLEAEPSSIVVYFGDFKLHVARSARDAMFNVADDPSENEDLLNPSRATPALYPRMRAARSVAAARVGESPDAPPEAMDRFRALGYVQ
jgi:hypothetical protein